jgi:pyruvate/2-oxoglutarate dehydrogenase complex dihydrolipoamide acyltransferase (E2) component
MGGAVTLRWIAACEMETFLIDVPMPSMGATVHELTVISLRVRPGDRVSKGQKVAELESDKSVFEFESPCDGLIRAVLGAAGEVKPSGSPFLQIETSDETLRHLTGVAGVADPGGRPQRGQPQTAAPGSSAKPASLVWTPRALKLAQEAGLIPEKLTDIEATGPGNRVSGDDVTRYLATRKTGA